MIPSILNAMIKGGAIFEVLNSYDKAMMTYDETLENVADSVHQKRC